MKRKLHINLCIKISEIIFTKKWKGVVYIEKKEL